MVREKAEKNNIHIDVEMLPGADIEMEADGRKIRQVLVNLLDNAVKFTPEGGNVKVRIRKIFKRREDF